MKLVVETSGGDFDSHWEITQCVEHESPEDFLAELEMRAEQWLKEYNEHRKYVDSIRKEFFEKVQQLRHISQRPDKKQKQMDVLQAEIDEIGKRKAVAYDFGNQCVVINGIEFDIHAHYSRDKDDSIEVIYSEPDNVLSLDDWFAVKLQYYKANQK